MGHGPAGGLRGFTDDRDDLAPRLRGIRGRPPTPGRILQDLLDEIAQGLLVGLRFRRGQLRGRVGPARAPQPDRRVADPHGLGQMPGAGAVSTLSDEGGPLHFSVRPPSASDQLFQDRVLPIQLADRERVWTSRLLHTHSSRCRLWLGWLNM